jgi:hypothetical protein|tara:strand:+ start:9600 stop:9752 length:153 start_codon:yes stop_codon:yes gene_type:complete
MVYAICILYSDMDDINDGDVQMRLVTDSEEMFMFGLLLGFITGAILGVYW